MVSKNIKEHVMAHTYIASIRPSREYTSGNTVEISTFYELEYVKYFKNREQINSLWKLFNKDFDKLESRYDMPSGTITNDLSMVEGLKLNARINGCDVIIVHTEGAWTSLNLENFLNNKNGEEIASFIEDAKL